MATQAYAGTLTQQAGTGNQAITGVGFQPKAVIFMLGDSLTAAGSSTAGFQLMRGMATSSTARAVITGWSKAGGIANDRQDNTKCISVITEGGVLAAADFVSFGADGFTINWTTNDSVARVIPFMCFGGSTITNAAVYEFQVAGSTGDAAYTGLGFKPDFMMIMGIGDTNSPPSASGAFADMGIGFASSSSAMGAMTIDTDTGPGFEKYQRTNKCYVGTDAAGGVYNEGSLTSFDADGFTINWTTRSASVYLWALCIKGGSYNVGAFNQPTSTGSQSVTGLTFQPTGLILASFNRASTTSVITADSRQSLGFVTGTSARAHTWGGASGTNHNTTLSTTTCIQGVTEGTPTVNASADLTSFNSDGFTISWGTADATARQIIYAALGDAAAASVDFNSWYNPIVQPNRKRTEVIGT